MPKYSDEYIDYWGDIFCALDIYQPSITFVRFLASPYKILKTLSLDADYE